jgi:hypothetical protein
LRSLFISEEKNGYKKAVMKNLFLFLCASAAFFIASCGSGKPEVNVDSLKADSALKAQMAFVPPKTDRVKDTFHMVTLPPVMEGDILLQIDTSEQCMAFGKATKSKYNNMAMIFIRPHDKMYMVLEAKDSVHVMPLTEWVNSGQGQHVVLMRLKNSNMFLTDKKTDVLKKGMKMLKGKPNDHYFSWSDDEIYCSEMVWKIYHYALKIDLTTPRKLTDFDLSGNLIKQQMKNKYGAAIPKNEQVVSPDDLLHSEKLEIIYQK